MQSLNSPVMVGAEAAWRFYERMDEARPLHRESFELGPRAAAAQAVVSPLLIVADERCPIAPLRAILPSVEAASATDKQVLWYEGDTGIALRHVGALIGANAQSQLWPEIMRWVDAQEQRIGNSRPRPRCEQPEA